MGNSDSVSNSRDLEFIEAVSRLETAGQTTIERFFSYSSATQDSTLIRNEILRAVRQTKRKCLDIKTRFLNKLNSNKISRLACIVENMEQIENTLSEYENIQLNDYDFSYLRERAKEVAEKLEDVVPLCRDLRSDNEGFFSRLGNSVKKFCIWFKEHIPGIRTGMRLTGTVLNALPFTSARAVGTGLMFGSNLLGMIESNDAPPPRLEWRSTYAYSFIILLYLCARNVIKIRLFIIICRPDERPATSRVRYSSDDEDDNESTGDNFNTSEFGLNKNRATKNDLHENISCDACRGEVQGKRYKCLQCPDYDLCESCFQSGNHKQHVLLLIRLPGAFNQQDQRQWKRLLNNGGNLFLIMFLKYSILHN